jgi:endonuclease/exonuclease/phosphatase family metal-dependent hydrolase
MACSIEDNYLDPDGPCYDEDHAISEPVLGDAIRVVSYNLEFGRKVGTAIDVLGSGELADADFILMQEMEREGVDAIALEHQLRYFYCPASVKKGRDWGNAILSRWPLLDFRKVLLPWADPYTNSRRIAVTARVELGGTDVLVYSTHTATPSLGLGARLDQMETILDDAGDAATVIIGGDLNTADPDSGDQVLDLFADHDFTWASDDATGTGSAFGFDVTLDYVFARGLEASASGTFDGDAGSDHKPIWVELEPP